MYNRLFIKKWWLIGVLFLMACTADESENNIVTPTAEPTAVSTTVAGEAPVATVASTEVPVEEIEIEAETAEATPAAVAEYEVSFVEGRCAFDMPPTAGEVTCGVVTVPANRQAINNGQTIDLPLAIFHSEGENPGLPMIYLDGGPGGSTLEALQFSYEDNVAPFLVDRSYIAFDQRGTGLSKPSLACPETRELQLELLDDVRHEELQNKLYLSALQDCYERLTADEGIDLSVYNSREGAADVNDIRRALGFETLHINGVSYGTRLGLTIMRDFPNIVASAVLDSPVPLQANLNAVLPEHVSDAYDAFFAGCAADPVCADAYPTLEADFYALVDQLNADPIIFSVPDLFSREEYDLWFDGESLKGTLMQTLYSNEMFPSMSKIIDQLQDGITTELRWIEANSLASGLFLNEGVYHSVHCNEDVPFYGEAEVATSVANAPEVADLFSDQTFVFDVCQIWLVTPAEPIENEAVASDIPTLLLAGEYDPVTPFAFGRQTAETLTQVYYFEVPHVGHGVHLSDACPLEMTLAFLRNSTAAPDSACLAEIEPPAFEVEGIVDTAVTLIPFSSDSQGVLIHGVRPESWDTFGETVFLRGQSAADQTAVVFQAFPAININPDEVIPFFTSQLGLTDLPSEPEKYTDTNGRAWAIYRVKSSGLPTDIAVYGDDDFVYIVLLAMQEGEGDLWREPLLFPALDTMRAE